MNDAELRTQLECAHTAAFGWAMVCCRADRDSAEEVLHDVYVTVLEGRARFGGQSAFRTWLFGVIRVTAASHRRRAWLHTLLLAKNPHRVEPDHPPAISEDAEAESRSAHLRAALTTLPARQREILHLVFYQELTIESAADVMRISVGSARTHYARGKSRLAALLGASEDL